MTQHAAAIALVALLAVACVLVRRRLRAGTSAGGRVLAVSESTALTPHVSLHVVRVAGAPIVIAAGPMGATLVCGVGAAVQSGIAPAPKRDRVRLLVVDDAAVMRMVAATILRAAGFEVVGEAANATDARARYRELRPDVVIADVVLPAGDGAGPGPTSALLAILAEDAGARVIVSGYLAQRSFIDAAMANGARAYVAKPFHPARVVDTVRRVVSDDGPASLANPEDVRERAENNRV